MTQVDVALLGVKIALAVAIIGPVVTFISLWINSRNASKLAEQARRADYLRSQIKELYGPLVFFAELNEQLWDRHEKIMAAYGEYFDGTRTGDPYSRQMTEVINKQNLYGQQIVRNSQSVLPVLRDHWGLLDPADAELVGQYILDTTILDLESDREGPTMPAEFYLPQLGLKSCLGPKWIRREGFAKQVREKLTAKQDELGSLTTGNR